MSDKPCASTTHTGRYPLTIATQLFPLTQFCPFSSTDVIQRAFPDKYGEYYTFNIKLNPNCGGSDGKASACNAGDPSLIPGSGRAPGEGNGNPLQYSCLENSRDRGAW